MTTTIEPQVSTIQLTASAAEIVRSLRLQQNLDESYALRVYISAQTCSGFQYGLALDNNARLTDAVFDSQGLKLLVDETSMQHMAGAKIDYIDDQRGKGFLVENTNIVPSCSCQGGSCGSIEN